MRHSTALAACLATLALTGCIVVPVPTALPDPEPFTEEALTPIQVGKTSRTEVRELFSHWQYKTDEGIKVANIEPLGSPDASTWVFPLHRQMGDISYAGLMAYGFAVGPVWGGKEDNYEYNWVLFAFNADDTVAASWVVREKSPCRPGIACHREDRLLVVAPEEVAAAARHSKPAEDACSLFLYSDATLSAPVTVGGDGSKDRDLWQDTFLRIEMAAEPGAVTLSVDRNAAQIAADSPSTINLPASCTGGEARYFAVSASNARLTAAEVPASSGVAAIQSRMLIGHVAEAALPVANPLADQQASVDLRTRTNCKESAGCEGVASLEVLLSGELVNSGTEVFDAQGNLLNAGAGAEARHVHRLSLTPGTYTLRYASPILRRDDTFALSPGGSYRQMVRSCYNDFYSAWCKEGRDNTSTVWIEDLATSRVVAGEKWCRKDEDCPESDCAIDAGRSLGICSIAGLECRRATSIDFLGSVVGATGRCEPATEEVAVSDWPGFPNFREAAPPGEAHGLVYIYSPEIQFDYSFNVETGSSDAPVKIGVFPRGHYVPFYAPPGSMFLLASRSDSRAAQSSATLEVRAGETYYVRGAHKQSWSTGQTPKLRIVSRDEAMAELKQCRLILADQ